MISRAHFAAAMLLAFGNWSCKLSREQFHEAARLGNKNELKTFLEAGLDINKIDSEGYTPLFYAVSNSQYSAAEYLLKQGADPFHPRHAHVNQIENLHIVGKFVSARWLYMRFLEINRDVRN